MNNDNPFYPQKSLKLGILSCQPMDCSRPKPISPISLERCVISSYNLVHGLTTKVASRDMTPRSRSQLTKRIRLKIAVKYCMAIGWSYQLSSYLEANTRTTPEWGTKWLPWRQRLLNNGATNEICILWSNISKMQKPINFKIGTRVYDLPIMWSTFCENSRDLRIVFFSFESNLRIESAVYTTQAVTRPDGPQAYRTCLGYIMLTTSILFCERTRVMYGTEYLFISIQS